MNTALAELQHAHSLVNENINLARRLSSISTAFKPDFMAELDELTAHTRATIALRQLLPLSNNHFQDEVSRYLETVSETQFAPQITRELEAIQSQHDRLSDSLRRSIDELFRPLQQSIDELTRPLRESAEAISAQFSTVSRMSPFASPVARHTTRADAVYKGPPTTQSKPLPAMTPPFVEKTTSTLTLVATRKTSPSATACADTKPVVTVPDILDTLAQSLKDHLNLAVRSGSSRLNLPGHVHHGATVVQYRLRERMIAFAVTHGDGTLHHLLLPCADIEVTVSLGFSVLQHQE